MTDHDTARHRRLAAVTAVAVAAILTLGACGASSPNPTGNSTSGSAGTTTGSPTTNSVTVTDAAGTTTGDATSSRRSVAGSGDVVTTGDDAAQSTTGVPTGGFPPPVDVPGSGPVLSVGTASIPSPPHGDISTTVNDVITGTGSGVATTTAPTLDTATRNWVAALCTAVGDAATIDVPRYPGGAGSSEPLDSVRSKALRDYAALHEAFSRMADTLAPLPPPTFNGGKQAAHDVVASLRAMAAVAADAPAALRTAHTARELEGAMDALARRMAEAEDLVGNDSPLLAVSQLMGQVPECVALASSPPTVVAPPRSGRTTG